MQSRKLTLQRENLAELTAAQLDSVVGAQATDTCTAADTELNCKLTLRGSRCVY